jgi:FkbM family methyltransferase
LLDNWYAGLARRVTDRPVIVRGHPMYLDANDSLGFLTREYEPGTSEIVSRLTTRGATAVDIGAHIGFYTMLLSRRVGSEGRVYAFEPETENVQLLRRNIALNRYNNVVLEDAAVSDETGHASLSISEHNRGDHRLVPLGSLGRTIVVRTIGLDSYFDGKRKPNIIKVDVQGAEWRVLAGMQHLLATASPIIVMEWTPDLIDLSGGDAKAVIRELRGRDFTVFAIREPSLDLTAVDDAWIAASRPRGFFANLLCVPTAQLHVLSLLR